MKNFAKRYLSANLFLLVGLLLKAQSPTDTITVQVRNTFWKTGVPISESLVYFSSANGSTWPLPFVQIIPGSDSSNIVIRYVPSSLPPDVCIHLNKTGDETNGVTILDLILLARHILGIELLTAPAVWAADSNHSNSVSTFDIVELRKLILGIYPELPAKDPWVVYKANLDPNGNCILLPTSSNPSTDTLRFVTVKTGDVDGDANPAGPYKLPQTSPLALGLPDKTIQQGEKVWISVGPAETATMTGFQFGIKFDPAVLSVVDLRTEVYVHGFGLFQDGFSFMGISRDVLPEQFLAGSKLMEFQVEALQTFSVSEAISLDQERLPALWVDSALVLHPFKKELAQLSAQSEPLAPVMQVENPYPNPFSEKTRINVTLDHPSTVSLEITDAAGRLLSQKTYDLNEGRQTLEITAADCGWENVLFYRIRSENRSSTGKLFRR